jgi:acyl carrier protein
MSSLATIQQLLIKEFGLTEAQVQPDALLEELGIDSLTAIEFMFLVEDEFKLKMPGEAVAIKTVGDIAREVDTMIAQQGTPVP